MSDRWDDAVFADVPVGSIWRGWNGREVYVRQTDRSRNGYNQEVVRVIYSGTGRERPWLRRKFVERFTLVAQCAHNVATDPTEERSPLAMLPHDSEGR